MQYTISYTMTVYAAITITFFYFICQPISLCIFRGDPPVYLLCHDIMFQNEYLITKQINCFSSNDQVGAAALRNACNKFRLSAIEFVYRRRDNNT